ncbi:hypothetical protein KUTeg_005921 [Tegillarca granosa]|uniref:Secreted protein n=1 Tax=Tegillarca granosa TaxID=220873 RepID=A0ABQ9FGV8_TEGGR|nr:hypothetical protein KUTeg_005921 [Tegillarca granosa]
MFILLYACAFELVVVFRGANTLQDQNVNIYICGIVVILKSPWLTANHNRKIYSTTMSKYMDCLRYENTRRVHLSNRK